MSRLGRDYIQTGYYLERYFPENSVRYISLLDGIDTGLELPANDITPFRAIINDLYAKDISKKIKSVKRAKQQQGLFIGWKPPYGYKTAAESVNMLAADEVAAAIVKEMFEMALLGMSCRQIAAWLNDKKIATPAIYFGLKITKKGPYSGLWSSERVAEMLKNRVYTGDMVQRKMEKVSYKSKKCKRLPQDSWVIVENTHAPIVSKEVFERVGALINSRKPTRHRVYDHLLKGMAYCKECQKALGVINRPAASGADVLYFVCRTYQRFTKNSACTSHCIKVKRISDVVTACVRKICAKYLDEGAKNAAAVWLAQELNSKDDANAELARLEREITDITAKMDRLYDDRLKGILDDADFMRLYPRLKASRSFAQDKTNKLAAASTNAADCIDIDELARDFILSADANKELLCALVERVEMSENKLVSVKFHHMPTEFFDLQ